MIRTLISTQPNYRFFRRFDFPTILQNLCWQQRCIAYPIKHDVGWFSTTYRFTIMGKKADIDFIYSVWADKKEYRRLPGIPSFMFDELEKGE